MKTAQDFNDIGAGMLPGYLGIEMLQVGQGEVLAQMPVKQCHMAPNGYLHAASVVALADTSCGNGTLASLPGRHGLYHHRIEIQPPGHGA